MILNLLENWLFKRFVSKHITIHGSTIYVQNCNIYGIGLTLFGKNVNISNCIINNCKEGIKVIEQ